MTVVVMKSVSILGCGWLGTPLAVSLLKDGCTVKGSTTSAYKISKLEALAIETHLVNIEEYRALDSFLNSEILIIAIPSKNTKAFQYLAQQIENSPVQKVLFVSSTSVYPILNSIVSENTDPLKTPLVEIENFFAANPYFETTILRLAGLFGPGRHPGSWFKNDKKIPYPRGFVNMIHQEDCIKIVHQIIHQNCWNQTFNACSNDHPTREDFYTRARKSLELDRPIFEKSSALKYKIVNSEKLQNTLNYVFIHDDLLSI